MKLLYLFPLAALLFLFSACSSDDDGPTLPLEEVLPGTWEAVEAEIEFESEILGLATTITVGEGRDFEGEVTFTEDPNEWESNLGSTFDMTIVTTFGNETDTETFVEVFEQEEVSGTWEINEDGQLEGFIQEVPTDEDIDVADFDAFDVQVVNNNRIILTNEINESFSEAGFNFTVVGSSRAVYERK